MLKKFFILGTLVALTGCAHNHWAGPAVVGGVVGYSIGHAASHSAVVYQPGSAYSCYIDGNVRAVRQNQCIQSYPYDPMARDRCFRNADQMSTVCHQIRQ